MRGIRQFLILAGLTAAETIRQPLCLLLTVTCVLLTALVPLLSLYNFGEDGMLARDSGLAFHFIIGLFISVQAASSALSAELRRGTASVVLTKPVRRELFFLSKYAGICVVVAGFSVCAALATLLSERVAEKFCFSEEMTGYVTDWQTGILLALAPAAAFLGAGYLNYRWRRPFGSTAFGLLIAALVVVLFTAGFFDRMGGWAPFKLDVQWRIVPASILVTLALFVLSAISLAFSARCTAVPTLAATAVFFLLGLLSDYLFGRHAAAMHSAALAHTLLPNWQSFWLTDALRRGGSIPWDYVLHAAGYAAAYTAAVLAAGLLAFGSVEMKERTP